jgi:hypothetical protein
MRHLNWPGIFFGAAAGLFANLLLFVALAGIGTNLAVQILIQMFGFFVAGYVAGRFALSDPKISGGFAALALFFFIVILTISGNGLNVVGLVVFGGAASLLGPAGGAVGYNRRNT